MLYNTSIVVQRRIKYLSLGNLLKIILRKLQYSKMYHNLLNMIPTSDNSNKCFSLSDRILTKVNSKNCVSRNSCFCFSILKVQVRDSNRVPGSIGKLVPRSGSINFLRFCKSSADISVKLRNTKKIVNLIF